MNGYIESIVVRNFIKKECLDKCFCKNNRPFYSLDNENEEEWNNFYDRLSDVEIINYYKQMSKNW